MSVHVLRSFVIGAYYRNLKNRCLQRHRSITSPAGTMKISFHMAPKGASPPPGPGCQVKRGASTEDPAAPWGTVRARYERCLLVP